MVWPGKNTHQTPVLYKRSSLTYLVTLNSRSTLEATMSVAGGQNLPKSIFYQGKYLILHNFWFTMGSKSYEVAFDLSYRYCTYRRFDMLFDMIFELHIFWLVGKFRNLRNHVD